MLRADRCSLILIILLPLTVAEAHAQRLLESDGIELRGTARIVTFGAGACSVVEDRETAAEYERKKANHGKPVDVWQLDFSVHNGSEQYLDHLIARYQIAAEWPPCTNWSGPSGTYAEQVQWGGAAGHIQESGRNVVSPGETKTATVFLVVFHEDEPRFENWSLDYEFGETAVATLGERPDMEQRRPEPRAEATAEATGADDSAGVGERGLPPGIGADETCSGKPAGTACWMELASHPRCYLWNPNLQSGETATWNNRCSGGSAQGLGVIKWASDGKEQVSEGSLVDGKKHGPWVIRFPDGREYGGPYVDGNRHGRWVVQYESGTVGEGPYVNGKKHGRWVEQYENGTVGEGPYVDGKRNGEWVSRHPDGGEHRGPFVDGKKQGRWVEQHENGMVGEGPYVNGSANGEWVYRYPDGREDRGSYVDGNRHGRWVEQYESGTVGEGPYVNGKETGEWVFRYPDGRESRGPYVNGEKHGRWVEQHEDGAVGEGPWVNGKANGEWVIRYPDGREHRGPLVNGKRTGEWVFRFPDGREDRGPFVNGEMHGRWVGRRSDGSTCSVQVVEGVQQGECKY